MKKQQVFICPMHPDVNSNEPGKCSECGMDLVPSIAKAGAGKKKEEEAHVGHAEHKGHKMHAQGHDHTEHHKMMMEDFRRRFWLILPLTVVVLLLSPQVQEQTGFSLEFIGREVLLFVLGTVIAAYGGWPFYNAAKDELKSKNWGMMTLVSLAVLTGYFFSVAATFLFPAFAEASAGKPAESLWWEISTLVLAFLFGHWMEMRAVLGAGGALKELAKLIPPKAHLFVGEKLKDVKTEELKKGDLVLVKPGEKIPADGNVVDGESSVNEAMITGESKPVDKKKGDEVLGGTINGDGSLTIKVTKTGTESALSQIMELISQAQETKPNVQKLAD